MEEFSKFAKYLKHPLVLVGSGLFLALNFLAKPLEKVIGPVSQEAGFTLVGMLLTYGWSLAVLVIIGGIGLQFYKLRQKSSLLVKVDPQKLFDQIQQLLAENSGQKESILDAVNALSEQRGFPNAEDRIEEAERELEKGNTGLAETIYSEVAYKKMSEGEQANQEAAKAFRRLGALAYLNNTDKALGAYKKATELDPKNADGWNNFGHLWYRVGEFEKAEEAYLLMLELAAGDRALQAGALGNLGLIYQNHGDLNKAIEFHEKSIAINKDLGLKNSMAIQYGNLGNVYATRGELDKAVEYYEKSLVISKELDDKEGVAINYSNIGLIYRTRRDLDKALEYLEKSLAINKELAKNEGMASDYGNIGLIYRALGDLEKAVEYHEKSLSINKELGRKRGIAIQYGNLGYIFHARGDLDKAEEYCEKSLAMNKELDRKVGMADQYFYLGLIHGTRGDLDKAVEYHEKSLTIFKELGGKEGMADVYCNLGIIAKTRGDLDQARSLWGKSCDLFSEIGSPNATRVQGWIDDLQDDQ